MDRRDRHHGRRGDLGLARTLLVVLVALALGAAAVAAYRPGPVGAWVEGWVDGLLGGPDAPDPAAVAPPAGLDLPAVTVPAAVAAPARPAPLDPRQVRRAVAPHLADEALGRHVLAAVGSLEEGSAAPALRLGRGTAVPASTTKVLTALAASHVLDPSSRFETRVVRQGRRVVLVGGGDPLLARTPPRPGEDVWPPRADVTTLARDTAAALRAEGVTRVRLGYDDRLFTGPAVNPHWRRDYVPGGIVAPVSALWVDEGRPAGDGLGRVDDPSRAAAEAFAGALQRAGVRALGAPAPRPAPPAAPAVATVSSATVAEIVEHLLLVSDNEAAEVLLRHVGRQVTGEARAEAGARAVTQVLVDLGVPTDGLVLHDGSGLSRQNRIGPGTLLAALRVAATGSPRLRTVVTGLPVAAFTGSLAYRFEATPRAGRGHVRAKTGTLTGVSSLAGVVTGADGVPMSFVLMADRVAVADTLAARDALDAAAAALARCRCGASR